MFNNVCENYNLRFHWGCMFLRGCQAWWIYLSLDRARLAVFTARDNVQIIKRELFEFHSKCQVNTPSICPCWHTAVITALCWELHETWSIQSEHKEKKKKKKIMLHIHICNVLCWHLRVFDLKACKWAWLWCKNIITQFCQTRTDAGRRTDTHTQGHHVSRETVRRASTALTVWFIPPTKLVFEDLSSHKYAAERSWKPSPCRRNQTWWD